jgi:hypothetical protein
MVGLTGSSIGSPGSSSRIFGFSSRALQQFIDKIIRIADRINRIIGRNTLRDGRIIGRAIWFIQQDSEDHWKHH